MMIKINRQKFLIGSLASVVLLLVCWFHYQPNLSPSVLGRSEQKLSVYFFDVGQGDAALIRTAAGENILVDGGPDNNILEKLGAALPLNDQKLSLVILTHPHSDHLVGLVEVLRRYRVERVIMTGVNHTAAEYLAWLNLIKEKKIPVQIIDSPRQLALSASTTLDFLWPETDLAGQTMDNLNNSSIVFKLVYASSSVLFMGDFEEEEKLAASSSAALKADILKVGHHGASDATSRDFLRAVSPQEAIISAGAGNQFGHPHYRVLRQLVDLSVRVWRTDADGDIAFISDGRSWQLLP